MVFAPRCTSFVHIGSTIILKIILTTGFFFLVMATSQTGDIIRKYDFENDGLGNYSLDVETGDAKGVITSFKHQQQGRSENKESNNGSLHVEGQILYKVDDSLSMVVYYTADERGYRPKIRWMFTPKTQPKNDSTTTLDLRGPDQKSGISSTVLGTLIGGNGK